MVIAENKTLDIVTVSGYKTLQRFGGWVCLHFQV